MNDNVNEYKMMIEENIELLGYEKIRYSLFAGELNNRQEYQLRIENKDNKFQVYMTDERAWGDNKYEFEDIFKAMDMFLSIMQTIVLSNRRKVKKVRIQNIHPHFGINNHSRDFMCSAISKKAKLLKKFYLLQVRNCLHGRLKISIVRARTSKG